ncbi:MAG: alkaline phosphatase D family protein, partial [Acidobacteriota bacterium]
MKRRSALWTLVGAGSIGIRAGLNGGKAGLIGAAAPAIITAESLRPGIPCGAMVGDPASDPLGIPHGLSALIWSRTDRPATMEVEYATRADFQQSVKRKGPVAVPEAGFTTRLELTGLRPGVDYFYRVTFTDGSARSEPFTGRFRTPGGAVDAKPRGVRLLWSGDTCGQGYGINRDWGGMRIYEAMRQRQPDFFIHSGDTIYADNPIPREIALKDGSVWRNIVTEAKSRPAKSVEDFRGAHAYNFLDTNLRRFHAEVPQVWQWDDHEFRNNWSPGNVEGSAAARQAFREFAPMRMRAGVDRIYRKISYGPLVDVFVVDMRSYRAANNFNRQEKEGPDTVYMGSAQLDWLAKGLAASRAKWKVVAADMPISLLVADG